MPKLTYKPPEPASPGDIPYEDADWWDWGHEIYEGDLLASGLVEVDEYGLFTHFGPTPWETA